MPYDALGNFIPDDTPSPDEMRYALAQQNPPSQTPSALDKFNTLGKAVIQNMPGSALVQGVIPYLEAPFQIAGSNLYGIGKSILNGQLGDNTDYAQQEAGKAMQATQYVPPTKAGQDVANAIAQAPEALLGSSMTPPLPEIANLGRGLSPDDIRVLAKQNIERAREFKNIPEDFTNAQAGLKRESALGGNTYGTNLQAVAEDIGDVMARRQARGESPIAGIPKGVVEVMDPNLYAVRNVNEGQFLRPKPTETGADLGNLDYGKLDIKLQEEEPIQGSKPNYITDAWMHRYFNDNTPRATELKDAWKSFMQDKAQELYPNLEGREALRALDAGYDREHKNDVLLKWLHQFSEQVKKEGADVPTVSEFIERANAANQITRKILPNYFQRYAGTPRDPFLESARQGITYVPASELEGSDIPTSGVESYRREAGFSPEGEIVDKEMAPALTKRDQLQNDIEELQAKSMELANANQQMIPDPQGRLDENGNIGMITNPEYGQVGNQIKAKQKLLEEAEDNIRKLKIASAYENKSDAMIRKALARSYRRNIAPQHQQFYPELFNTRDVAGHESPEYTIPEEAPMLDINPAPMMDLGFTQIARDLIGDILDGKIPVEQIPNLAQPNVMQKWLAKKVEPRIKEETAERNAKKNYKENVLKHYKGVIDQVPDSSIVGGNAKVFYIDESMPVDEIIQHLSDETFILDHCIGQGGRGGEKHLFTGEPRQYIPMRDPVTGNAYKGSAGTTSYVEQVESGEKEIASIRDKETGLPVGTIELGVSYDLDSEPQYSIGYVSGYKNHSNPHDGIDPAYRDALRDTLNNIKDYVTSSDGNEARSGVFDMQDPDQIDRLRRELKIKENEWRPIKNGIKDTLDGDRYITIEQAKDAVDEYKRQNPPVPATTSGFPPSGRDATEYNIVTQGLSRDNLQRDRQLNAGQLVEDQSRFVPLTRGNDNTVLRVMNTYQSILNRIEHNGHTRPSSDYNVYRDLQQYVDQIEQGDIRFADLGLTSPAQLAELKDVLQRHADAVGQLAHYNDTLQRNGYRTPLASHDTNSNSWETYLDYLSEIGLDDPSDIRTRLRDTIEHASPQDLMANMPRLEDEMDVAEFKHLLEIHNRAIHQAVKFPAPTAPATAPAEQRGIPLTQWTDLIRNQLGGITRAYGEDTRIAVSLVLVDAINSQMDTAVNERPVQVSNFLLSESQNNPNLNVRVSLRNLAGAIDFANAEIQNARNAPANVPANTEALPSLQQYGRAVQDVMDRMPTQFWSELNPTLERIHNEIRNEGSLPHQNPARVVQGLVEEANYQEREGSRNLANNLRELAISINNLTQANQPQAIAPQPRMIAGGADTATAEDRVNARLMQIGEVDPILRESLNRMLNAHNFAHEVTVSPIRLARQLRAEANEALEGGEGEFGTALMNIVNDIESANPRVQAHEQMPAHVPNVTTPEPRRTPRDIAETVRGGVHQSMAQRMQQIDELTNAINNEIRSIPVGEAGLRQARMFYEDPNNLPEAITNHTHQFEDAERIANYLLQHVNYRLDNETRGNTDPQLAYESVSQYIRDMYIDSFIRRIGEGDQNAINELAEEFQNHPSHYGLENFSNNERRAILDRIQAEGLHEPEDNHAPQLAYENASEAVRRLHTHMLADIQNNGLTRSNLADVIETDPIRYGLGNFSPEIQRQVGQRIRNEGVAPAPQLERPNTDISNAIQRRITSVNQNELSISQAFNTIVEAASNEYDPSANPNGFIRSLMHRINSVEGGNHYGENQTRAIVRQLRLLVDDVQTAQIPRREGHKRGGVIRRRVRMAEGGETPVDPRAGFKDLINKINQEKENDPNRVRTYIERLQDMGRLPTPEVPKVGTAPRPSGGGAGFAPNTMNPFNPDSPLNRKKGGRVHMQDGGTPLPEDIQRAVDEGRITPNQADYIHNARLNPVPEHWGDHMSYQDRYNDSLEPRYQPTEEEINQARFLRDNSASPPDADYTREQLRQQWHAQNNPKVYRPNPARTSGVSTGSGERPTVSGGGMAGDPLHMMTLYGMPLYHDGGDVNIDAMRYALMKG